MDNNHTPEAPTALTCAQCGKPATCTGEYETFTGVDTPACDDCCGHGNEDGHCSPIETPTSIQDGGHITSTIDVEYYGSGTFQGDEEECGSGGLALKDGQTVHVITKENLAGLHRERDEALAEVERLKHSFQERTFEIRAELAKLREEKRALKQALRATLEDYLNLVTADLELMAGFIADGDPVPPEVMASLRERKETLTAMLAIMPANDSE